MNDLIFALDIGTRTVIGIVGSFIGDKFKVIDWSMKEHETRSIIDGQVNDINQALKTVLCVKEDLERKLDTNLEKVFIAAAGRVLKTKSAVVSKDINNEVEINGDLIAALEIDGVKEAQRELDKGEVENSLDNYYCVGYSVTNYYLNDYIIKSLLGQRGKKIGVEILATFLPQTVIDSLYTLVKKAGLEAVGLTLEPIAAINAVVPGDMKMLNIALVDIGAGTSDIAITSKGSVVSYSMVPKAGDEITETICENYVVDFNTGEYIKKQLIEANDIINFTDVLGFKQEVNKEDVLRTIEATVDEIAASISEEVVKLNGKSPNAMFLVGGGSKILGLNDGISKKLNLSPNRIASRGCESIQNIEYQGNKLVGPEFITPIGISLSSIKIKGNNLINVKLNGETIKLLDNKGLTVQDVLIKGNIRAEGLVAKNGMDLEIVLNGEKRLLLGGVGKQAEIYINNKVANIKSKISEGDEIAFIPAKNGANASYTLNDIINRFNIILDDDTVVLINEEIVKRDPLIKNGDLINVVKVPSNLENELNNKKVPLEKEDKALQGVKNENMEGAKEGINVIVNGSPIRLEGTDHLFIDIFKFIDINVSVLSNNFSIKLNGNKASYTDELKEDDIIEISM